MPELDGDDAFDRVLDALLEATKGLERNRAHIQQLNAAVHERNMQLAASAKDHSIAVGLKEAAQRAAKASETRVAALDRVVVAARATPGWEKWDSAAPPADLVAAVTAAVKLVDDEDAIPF